LRVYREENRCQVKGGIVRGLVTRGGDQKKDRGEVYHRDADRKKKIMLEQATKRP